MAEETPKIAPTASEATDQAHKSYDDRDTVLTVQRALLSLGYVDGGPADGTLNQKTKDEILTFRARNNLQLIPVIDDELLTALKTAPTKSLPLEQVTATSKQIAPRVEVVKKVEQVQNKTWWMQFWAWLTGLPASLVALLALIIENLDDATNAISPLKNLLFDVQGISPWIWIGAIAVIAIALGWQARQTAQLSKKIEQLAVEGYQRGTIKNDLPPKEEA